MLLVNVVQVIINVVLELMLCIMLPGDRSVVIIVVVMTIITTFTVVVCIVIATCGCPVAPICCGRAWVIVGVWLLTQWDECLIQLL
jgi:hypothetical protein